MWQKGPHEGSDKVAVIARPLALVRPLDSQPLSGSCDCCLRDSGCWCIRGGVITTLPPPKASSYTARAGRCQVDTSKGILFEHTGPERDCPRTFLVANSGHASYLHDSGCWPILSFARNNRSAVLPPDGVGRVASSRMVAVRSTVGSQESRELYGNACPRGARARCPFRSRYPGSLGGGLDGRLLQRPRQRC